MLGLCFLTSLFPRHGRWWFLTYLKPSGGVSSPLSYKLLYTAGVSSPSHEKPLVLGEITLLMEVSIEASMLYSKVHHMVYINQDSKLIAPVVWFA